MSCSPFQRAWRNGFSLSSLQPFLCRSLRVMLFLIADVADDPRQIPCSKADHTIASLPIKQVAIRDAMVDVVGTGSLHLTDPVADKQRWRHTHDEVHVILNAANFVESTSRASEARGLSGIYADAGL